MIRQKGRTLSTDRRYLVCFLFRVVGTDERVRTRTRPNMGGPEKGVNEAGERKFACLLSNGGRKIIWKPVIKKEWLFSIDVDCFAEGIQPGKTCSSKWKWNVSLNLVSMSKHEQCIDEKMPTDGIPDNRQIGLRYGMKLGRRDAWRLVECQPDVGIHWSPCWSDGDGLTSRHRLSL